MERERERSRRAAVCELDVVDHDELRRTLERMQEATHVGVRAREGHLDLQPGQRAITVDDRLEHRVRFARIRIESEIQRIGGDAADVDDAAFDRLRRIAWMISVSRWRSPAETSNG